MADVIEIGKRGCILAAALLGTLLVAGCPADRAMFFDLSVRVLDGDDHPVAGDRVWVIGNARGVSPDALPAVEEAAYYEVGPTDANGVATFVISNTEPVGVLDCLLFDAIFPPCVQFMIMLPDTETVGYEAEFCPRSEVYDGDVLWARQGGVGKGDVRPRTFAETVRYRRFDVGTGAYLEGTFCDGSGGLDVVIGPALRDGNDGWLMEQPAVHITLHKGTR